MNLKKLKECNGQALVEMAIILPIILLMLMGMIDFGRIIAAELAVSNITREAARQAAVGKNGTSVDITSATALGVTKESFTITLINISGLNDAVKAEFKGSINFVTPVIPIMINIFGSSIDDSESFTFTRTTVMKRE